MPRGWSQPLCQFVSSSSSKQTLFSTLPAHLVRLNESQALVKLATILRSVQYDFGNSLTLTPVERRRHQCARQPAPAMLRLAIDIDDQRLRASVDRSGTG